MPDDARILAIGDIHGSVRALDALLDAVDPHPDDLIVTLGDYIDRGIDSAGVIDRLLKLMKSHRLVALRGNHEEMMMQARQSPEHLQIWKCCGGDTALMSYGPQSDEPNLMDVPEEHWHFLDDICVDLHETATHFFVHAGVRPNLALDNQTPLVLRWEPFNNPPPHCSGKIMICGHTPQKSGLPKNLGHAICIDTLAHDGGWITCLDVTTSAYWQANERGGVRRGVLT